MGRLIDADILIAELKESALHHCNNPREDSLLQRDRVIVRAQPTVEAIPKADYEQRLKADMVAMLTEIQLEIEEIPLIEPANSYRDERYKYLPDYRLDVYTIIQQKINALKGDQEGKQ